MFAEHDRSAFEIHVFSLSSSKNVYADAIAAGKPIVIVMGDSNAEGWGLPEEATIPRQLEKSFNNDVTFVNSAIRFAGPILHAIRLREILPTYHPAAVLWLLTEKDYGYDRFADALAVERDKERFPILFSRADTSPVADWIRRLERYLPGKIYLLEYLAQSATVRQTRAILDRAPISAFDPCLGVSRLLQAAEAARVPVLPVLMPIGPNYLFETDLARFPETWNCVVKTSHIAPIDARRPEFQGEELMLPHDSHFNARGAEKFAHFLALHLGQLPVLQGRDLPSEIKGKIR